MQAAVESAEPHVLIVRGTKVPGEAIRSGTHLSLIVRAGAGYDSIDVDEASRRGVFVANCPGKNSVAVAELAWGLILSCDRRIPDQTADLRQGIWNKKEYSNARGLKGRTLGIVGTGQIGMEVARRGLAFGMDVVGWGRSLTPETAERSGIGYCQDLLELASASDVVSVHVAANEQTRHLIDHSFISRMRPESLLINTSRGSVVDQQALAAGIREKQLKAGLDVFADEPGDAQAEFTDEIVSLAGVYGTHHVGASTDQAQDAIAEEAVRIVEKYLETGEVCNCINLASTTPATSSLTIRHLNQPGVLAHVFRVIGEARINVEEMQNVIYDGAQAACARIQMDDRMSADHIEAIRQNENVLSIEVTNIG
jgi:D-3-phosphoglycerate dehydrogenase